MKGILFLSAGGSLEALISEARERLRGSALKEAKIKGGDIRDKLFEFKREGIFTISAVPVLVFGGRVYNIAARKAYESGSGLSLRLLPPLIEREADFTEVKSILNGGKASVFCIHKTEADIKPFLKDNIIWQTGENTKELLTKIRLSGLNSVEVFPLMMNLGFHYKNDILNRLKPELERNGIIVSLNERGLLEYKGITEMILRRI